MMSDVPTVGLLACTGLALPAPQWLEDRGPTAPGGVLASVCEAGRDLVPAPLRRSALQGERLGAGLTRHGQRQGQAPGMQGGLGAARPHLLRSGLHMVRRREAGRERRGEAGGLPAGLPGAGAFGVARIQAIH